MRSRATANVEIIDDGNMVGFRALTRAALIVITEKIDTQSWMWLGQTLYVPADQASAVMAIMEEEGLVMS